jgi:hypothetical protein
VHERVESTELRVECAGNIREVRRFRPSKIERKDDRLRQLLRVDLVVIRFELSHDPCVKDDCRTSVCARNGEDAAQSSRRAGDENDAAVE